MTGTLEARGLQTVYQESLQKFYKNHNYQRVWFSADGEALRDADKIQEIIHQQAFLNGLKPDDYNFETLIKRSPGSQEEHFRREWQLTNTLMHYMHDVQAGRIDPENYDATIFRPEPDLNLAHSVAEFLESGDYKQTLQALEPQQPEYQTLQTKLTHYREIADEGGWPSVKIEPGTIINPRESHNAIAQIRARLQNGYHDFDGTLPDNIWVDDGQTRFKKLGQILQDLEKSEQAKDENPDLFYNKDLARKVAEFQYIHGQKADGIIGPETVEAMNVSADKRVDQIVLAMERWRWLPDDLGDRHVRLNIAGFYVRGVENGEDRFVMPIIVGQAAHQTPVFSSVIKNVKFHPDWTAPDSIAERYLIDKIQTNPDVIGRLGYQVQRKSNGEIIPWDKVNIQYLDTIDLDKYQFRQKPGANNALGLARFSIKNDYSIFMHGTPKTHLFDKENRIFSSGCIRVEDPSKMARFLLENENISDREIEALYMVDKNETAETDIVPLENNLPVHLTYMTAWIDQENMIHFTDDVYNRDQELRQALTRLN